MEFPQLERELDFKGQNTIAYRFGQVCRRVIVQTMILIGRRQDQTIHRSEAIVGERERQIGKNRERERESDRQRRKNREREHDREIEKQIHIGKNVDMKGLT